MGWGDDPLVEDVPAETPPAPRDAAGLAKWAAQQTVVGMSPEQREATNQALTNPADPRNPLAVTSQRVATAAFSTQVQDRYDQAQEAQYLEYAAANSYVAPQVLAKARQLWIAKPQYDLDYIVNNFSQIEKEVQAERIPWDLVAREHPVLAKYLKDPSTISQTLQASSVLTGINRVTGGNVTFLDKEGKPSERFVQPSWMMAARDAITNNTMALLSRFNVALGNVGTQAAGGLRKLGVPDEMLGSASQWDAAQQARLLAYQRYERQSTSAKDYRGFFDQDNASFATKAGRVAEWGADVLASNADFLIGGGAAAEMKATKLFLNAYSVLQTFPKAMEATDDPFRAAIVTAVAAPVYAKALAWSPAGTAIGARADSIIRNGVAKTAADALATRSWASLGRSIALKGGWDALTGQVALGIQSATDEAVTQLGRAWGGKETDEGSIGRAFWNGVTNPDGVPLALFGTAHLLISDVGNIQRSRKMADALDQLHAQVTSPDLSSDPQLHEQQIKEIVNQPGHDPFFYLPLDRFQEVVTKAGLDPREVAKQIHGDYTAYDAAVAEGRQHLTIPVEKMRTVLTSKHLGDFAMQEGKLDLDVLSKVELKRVTDEFQAALATALKTEPDQLAPSGVHPDAVEVADSALGANKDRPSRQFTIKGFPYALHLTDAAERGMPGHDEPYLGGEPEGTTPEEHAGKGQASALYVRALMEAQKSGRGIVSDTLRSEATNRMYERLMEAGVPFVRKLVTAEGGLYEGETSTEHFSISPEALKGVDLEGVWRRVVDKTGLGERAVYDALLAQAGNDPQTAKTLYATVKALQTRHPEFTTQQIYDATYSKGGLFGPPLDAANEAVPGMHQEAAKVQAVKDAIVDRIVRESGLYNSREWFAAFQDKEQAATSAADAARAEDEARAAARERVETAIRVGVRNQIIFERRTLEAQAREEIKKDAGQRVRHFFTDNEVWGHENNDPRTLMMRDPETGRPLRLLRSEVAALGFDPDQLPRGTVTNDPRKAMDVDMAANAFGFEGSAATGDAARRMLVGLRDSLPEGAFHKAWADARLRDLHESALLTNPRELINTIMDGVQNEKIVPALMSRLHALREQLDPVRKQREAVVTPEDYAAYAKQIIGSKSLRDLKPEVFVRAAKAASERALAALEKGNHGRAFDATEAAILNHYMYRQAREISNSVGAAYSKLSERATSDGWRAQLGKADPAYRNLHDALLGSLGIGEEVQPAAGQDFLADFKARAEANGQIDNVAADEPGGWDSGLVRTLLSGDRKWRDLTPGEVAQVVNAIDNIHHVAKGQTATLRALRDANTNDLINSGLSALSKGGAIQPQEIMQERDKEGRRGRSFLGQMWKDAYNTPARLFLKLLGPEIKEKVDGGFLDASNREHELLSTVYPAWKKTQEIWENDPDFHRDLPGLSDALRLKDANGNPMAGGLSKKYLVQALKWIGSASGREKLLKAFDTHVDEVLRLAGVYLQPHEVDAIQAEHGFFERELLPLKSEQFERQKGLPFPKVESLGYEITFLDGTTRKYAGGYYPIHWDGRPGVDRTARPVEMDTKGSMFPHVSNGSLNERTKFVGIPDLDWNNVPAHILQDLHHLAFSDFVNEANRVLLDPRMINNVRRYLGPEHAELSRNWLERVASASTGHVSGHLAELNDALRLSRSAFVTGAIGLNLPIFAAHMVHPMAVAAMRDGIGGLVNAGASMSRVLESAATSLATGQNPIHEEIMSKSKYLPRYLSELRENMSRWFKGTYDAQGDTWTGKFDRFQDKAQAVGFWHLRAMTELVSEMIWDAKYRREMGDHGDDARAVEAADDQVRASMPNYNVMETPSILSDKRSSVLSSLLVFHTFWSKYRELFIEGKADLRGLPFKEALLRGNVNDAAGTAWRTAAFAGRAAAMLTFGVVAGEYLKGQGKRADEDWDAWLLRREATAPLKLFPYASDLFEHGATDLIEGKIPRRDVILNNPYFAPTARLINSLMHTQDPRRPIDEKVADVLTSLLMVGGLPAVAPIRALRYGYRVATGDERPRGPFDVASGVVYGKKYGRSARWNEKNPLTGLQDLASEND